MYAEGVGVPQDYARAFHWFQEADKQGSAEAKYAMSTYFSLGMQGVADQEKAKAVVLQLDSALAGFKPSARRLQQLLARVSRYPIRRWYGPYAPYGAGGYGPVGYGAPGDTGYPPDGGGYPPAGGGQYQRGHIPTAAPAGDPSADPQGLAEDSAAAGDSSRVQN
jgi:TPR repeat protein